MEWAVFRIHPAELWAGQAACTLWERQVLGWTGLAAPRGISQPAAPRALLGSCSCHWWKRSCWDLRAAHKDLSCIWSSLQPLQGCLH